MEDDIQNDDELLSEDQELEVTSRAFFAGIMEYQNNEDSFSNKIEDLGYTFDSFGNLIDKKTGGRFEFNVKKDDHVYNQKRYEVLGEAITDYIYEKLVEIGLKKLRLPLDAENEPTTNIFHTVDAFRNEKLVVLIHGSGVVRAGQWARRLIINDNLKSGSQLPFIKRAVGLGYGVIVLNTNDNSRMKGDEVRRIRGSETPENHANYVFHNLILGNAATKYIAIVAHSYGGIVTINLCKTFSEYCQRKIIAIAFTDSPHSLIAQDVPIPLREWIRKVSRNWVSSAKPLDTPLIVNDRHEVDCYSAGTQRHDLTTWMSFSSIYEFIDSKYRKALEQEDQK